ncbi:MAG: DUF4388 domain-containing protein [Myxococcales bacterium]
MSRILLVEDEIGAIAALRRVLSRSGFDVLIATNGADALSLASSERPAAVVLSGELQGGDSAAVHEALARAQPDRPLLVLGGTGLGADGSRLSRPTDGAELLEQLRSKLGPASPPAKAPLPAELRPTLPTPPTAASLERLAARRELQAAREQAEQAARRKAEAMAQAAELRRQELAARREEPPISAASPILPPPRAALEDRIGSAPEPEAQEEPPREAPAPEQAGSAGLRAEAEGRSVKPEPAASAAALASRLFDDIDEPTSPRGERPLAPAVAARPARAKRAHAPRDVPPEGDLSAAEPARLLAACHRAHWTGELRFHQGAARRSLYWDEGRIVGASSSSQDEQLDAHAYRRGLLTREQQRQMRAEGPLGTRRAALLMVERTFLKPAELFPLVQERVEEVAYAACGGFEGRYELLPAQVPADERVALSRSPLAVMTEGIRRKYLLERLLERLGGPATLLRPVEEAAPDLSELALTARERRLAQALDGMRNVEELLFECGCDPLAGLQILHALVLAGIAEIAVRGLAADLAPEVQLAIDLGRVAEKYEQVRTASYFELLGVGLDATTYEIQQAYERLAREFQPDRYGQIKDPSVQSRLEEIQRVLAEARDILGDEGLRTEYSRHRRRT